MYIPRHTLITDQTLLHQFMQRFSFATLVTVEEGRPVATHLPFMLDTQTGTCGTLIAHVARANKQWKTFAAQPEVIVIFQGDHTYISPSWYSEPVNVPTWNYMVVHAYGVPRIIEEPAAIVPMLDRLVNTYEQHYAQPWRMELPEDYLHQQIQAIVAFEIDLTRLEGKFKLSQNRSAVDQQRVIAALLASDDPMAQAVGREMEKLQGQ